MIDVSNTFLDFLNNSDTRNLIYKVELLRDTDTSLYIDITDRVEEININHDLNTSNSQCNLVLDNSDGELTPENLDSSYNLIMGIEYDPLLDSNHLIKISAGFKELANEDIVVSGNKTVTITDFSETTRDSTVTLGPYGLCLKWTLGAEQLIASSEIIDTSGNIGRHVFSNGDRYEYRYGQTFTFTGNVISKLSRIEFYTKKSNERRYYGGGNDVFWYSIAEFDHFDDSVDDVNYINGKVITKGKEITDTIVLSDSDPKTGWRSINTLSKDFFLYPNKKYYLKLDALETTYGKYGDSSTDLPYIYHSSTDTYLGGEMYHMPTYFVSGWGTFRHTHQYLDKDLAFRAYARKKVYYQSGNAYLVIDCGNNVSEYSGISYEIDTEHGTSDGTVSFEYASSSDGSNYSAWYTSLSSVPVQRFIKIKIILNSNINTNTLYLNKIQFSYNTVISNPDPGMITIFTGILGDDIDIETFPRKINISARDFSKPLQDLYIKLSRSYDNLVPEVIIQDLLKQYIPLTCLYNLIGVVDFYYPATEFFIKHYQIKNMNLWDALQKISDIMGWYLRFDENGVLKLFKRKYQLSPDIVFNEDLIIKQGINTSDADIRNEIYVKAESPDGIIEYTAKDEDSIKKYGWRFMEVDRDLASYLHTQEQVKNLAEAILEDLSNLRAESQFEIPFYPIVQVGDIVGIDNNNLSLSSSDHLFKVTSITHRLSPTSKRTILSVKTHKNFRQNVSFAPNAPSDLTVVTISRTIQNYPNSGWTGNSKTFYYPKLEWNAPTLNDDNTPIEYLSGYNIYRSYDGTDYNLIGFVPLKLAGVEEDINWYIDYSCGPFNVWYKITAINKFGNESEYSNTYNITVPSPVTS